VFFSYKKLSTAFFPSFTAILEITWPLGEVMPKEILSG